jgi:hypothetical protein
MVGIRAIAAVAVRERDDVRKGVGHQQVHVRRERRSRLALEPRVALADDRAELLAVLFAAGA